MTCESRGETRVEAVAGVASRPWWLIGESVRGASHLRHGLPNQDSILSYPYGSVDHVGTFELASRAALAVADGHGSAKCFRSHIGSDLAVHVAITVAKEFLKAQEEIGDLPLVKRMAEERLPRELALKWNRLVDEHYENHAFSPEELDVVARVDDRRRIEHNPRLAYGSTLLLVMVTQTFAIYLQLGDGDLLTVSEDGEVMRPMAGDERLIANETTSLSAKDAWRDFRYAFQVFHGQPPALILLATDGYANSFASDSGFLQVGGDMLRLIRASGVKQVKGDLPAWLNEASAVGSGDDITLGLFYRDREIGTETDAVAAKAQEEIDAATQEQATDHH